MKKLQLQIQILEDRKTLSTRGHILLAGLLDEDDRGTRGKIIIAVMNILKKME